LPIGPSASTTASIATAYSAVSDPARKTSSASPSLSVRTLKPAKEEKLLLISDKENPLASGSFRGTPAFESDSPTRRLNCEADPCQSALLRILY
jgi:hypothetical protein